jgi:glutaredoxin
MVLNTVTDKLRTRLLEALTSTRGDGLKPVKILREVLGTANDLAGRPLCSQAELDERRLQVRPTATASKREAAPVMLYFDGKDHRSKKKIEELLGGRDIPFRILDVTDDEATRSWATTQAKQLEFPLVFIAGAPVGGLHELMQLDVNGELKKRVFGG